MTSTFDRWEKDPFFSAAEEVQESTDRMESAYRLWIHERKNFRDSEELRRDLCTFLGTAKWQLEQFERAVGSNYANCSSKEPKIRRHQFIVAIKNQISIVENSLKQSPLRNEEIKLSWIKLDQGEKEELVSFLSAPLTNVKNHDDINVQCFLEEGKRYRRSRSEDMNVGKITIPIEDIQQRSLNKFSAKKSPSVHSFSEFTRNLELAPKTEWPKSDFNTCKGENYHQLMDNETLKQHQHSRGTNPCSQASKNCPDGNVSYSCKHYLEKLMTIQSQLRWFRNFIRRSRTIQIILWVILAISLIVIFVARSV